MNSYPVNLLLKNRRCLIAGGGPVALRKAVRLLAAEAQVIVVAPEVVSGLKEMAEERLLEIVFRKCQADDLVGVFLAFFAADDHKFNRRMLLQAQSQGILSCAVDENWPAGDFITPASCERDGLQLTIATGGRSCVRAKSVKNLLSGQLGILSSRVVLTTFTVAGSNLDDNFSVLSEVVADALKYISGVREFYCRIADNCFELVTLLGADEKIKRLVRLVLVGTVGLSDARLLEERRENLAFIYLLQKSGLFGETPSALLDCEVTAVYRIGSGLKKLDSLVKESADLSVNSDEKWKEYEYYCRKL